MTKYTKAIAAMAAVLLPTLHELGIALPAFLNMAWIDSLLLVLTPVLVFFLPNEMSRDQRVAQIHGSATTPRHRSPAWAGLAALFAGAVMTAGLAGCSGTNAAYKAADGLEETAAVMSEHYYALVREANDLKGQGLLTGQALAETQQIVQDTRPIILALGGAAQSYTAVSNAETEGELADAIGEAAEALNELINAIKAVGGSTWLLEVEDSIRLAAWQADLIHGEVPGA